MLGRAVVEAGHGVTVLGTKPYHDSNVTNLRGIHLVAKASLNPEHPGGWLYIFLSLLTVWRQQPDILHLHSWRSASLAWLAALFSPETTIVWTIDALPRRHFWLARLIAQQTSKVCDVITVPTRTLQYVLLTQCGLATNYIPDGYEPSRLKDLPLKSFNLRKSQYCLLLASDAATIRQAIRAFTATKSRKKLVIVASPAAPWQRLINRKSFVSFVGEKTGRQLTTLVRNAASVIVAPEYKHLETVLQAMNSGRSLVAANTTLLQETIGVTGQYFRPGKIAELRDAIALALKSSPARGAAAKKRAQNHFTWERITPEYLALYRYRELAYVPMDSVRPALQIANR